MKQDETVPPDAPIPFSNSIRLRGRQWLGVTLFAVVLIVLAPELWKLFEGFELEPDYRIPHDLSQDYWLYERYAGLATQQYDGVLIGDSVIWGEYVTRQQTLSHYLNDIIPLAKGRPRDFANLGLDGAHPLALLGLVEHYADSVKDMNVVLECNPLWVSSPQADLQDDKKINQFNHPKLVPQFSPAIPSYQEEISLRLGILVEQRVAFSKWTNHLQQAYYEQRDIPTWTLEHPYENPLSPLTRGLPASTNDLRHTPQPWYKSGITKQDYPWVDLETSLQWRAFQQVVELLQKRGNRVFVLVGPFNEHLLTQPSLERYQQVKNAIGAWLKEKRVRHLMPAPLPSAQYGDASHPLADGYATLARQLQAEPFFRGARLPK